MTTKEFVEKYKKVYTSLINDPDTKETENKTREEVASDEAQQRVKQSINNEKALSMAAELSSVEKLAKFITKEDIKLDDIIYGTPSRSHLVTMKKPVTLFDIDTKQINVKEPPSNSSKETKKELRSLQDQTKNVDKELKERINREDKNLEITFYEYLDKNNLDYDKNFIKSIIQETRIYVQHFKYKFNRPRPRQLGDLVGIPVIQQEGEASNTPAYPSGHTTQARLIALFLGREHPEHREELLKIAEEIGINRIKGGFHYTSDHEAGRLVANDLWASLLKKVRRMKKSFGSDPVSELVKDYMEYRKDKWSNITKIGNFVTEQSLEKAVPKDKLPNYALDFDLDMSYTENLKALKDRNEKRAKDQQEYIKGLEESLNSEVDKFEERMEEWGKEERPEEIYQHKKHIKDLTERNKERISEVKDKYARDKKFSKQELNKQIKLRKDKEKEYEKVVTESKSIIAKAKAKTEKGSFLQRTKARAAFALTKKDQKDKVKETLDNLNKIKESAIGEKYYEKVLSSIDKTYEESIKDTQEFNKKQIDEAQKNHERSIKSGDNRRNADWNKSEIKTHELARANIQKLKDTEAKKVKEVNAAYDKLEKKVKRSKQYKDEQAAIKGESKEYAETEKRTENLQDTAEKKVDASLDKVKETSKKSKKIILDSQTKRREERKTNVENLSEFVENEDKKQKNLVDPEKLRQQALGEEPSWEYQEAHRNKTEENMRTGGATKGRRETTPKQPKPRNLSFEESVERYEKHIADQEESHKSNIENKEESLKALENLNYDNVKNIRDKEIEQTRDKVAKAKIKHANTIEELNDEHESFKDQHEADYNRIIEDSDKGKYTTIDKKIADVQTKIDKKSTKALQAELEELEDERMFLEEEFNAETEGGAKWYENVVKDHKSNIKKLNEELETLENELNDLKSGTEVSADLTEANKTKITELKSEIDNLKDTHTNSITEQKAALKEAKENKTFSTEEQAKINELSEKREKAADKVDESTEKAIEGEQLGAAQEDAKKDSEDMEETDPEQITENVVSEEDTPAEKARKEKAHKKRMADAQAKADAEAKAKAAADAAAKEKDDAKAKADKIKEIKVRAKDLDYSKEDIEEALKQEDLSSFEQELENKEGQLEVLEVAIEDRLIEGGMDSEKAERRATKVAKQRIEAGFFDAFAEMEEGDEDDYKTEIEKHLDELPINTTPAKVKKFREDQIKSESEEPKPVAEKPVEKPVAEEPKPVAEEPKPVAEEPKPVAEEPKPTPTPEVDERRAALEGLGDELKNLYEENVGPNSRKHVSQEEWVDHMLETEWKKYKTPTHVRLHVSQEHDDLLKDRDSEAEKKNKEDAIRAEQAEKAEEEKIKQRIEQENTLSEKAKALGYEDKALEQIFKDNEDLSSFEQQIENEESVTKDRLYNQIDSNILPSTPEWAKESESLGAALAELTPQRAKDFSNKIKDYFENKLKSPQSKGLEAAYKRHIKSVYDSLKYIDPNNKTLFDKDLKEKLQKRSNDFKVVARVAKDASGKPYLSAEKQSQIHKEFKDAYDKAKDQKELKEALENIDSIAHEGIQEPTAEDKFEVSETDKPEEPKAEDKPTPDKPTPDKPAQEKLPGFNGEAKTPEEKLKAEQDQAGEPGTGTEGQMQMFVPGRGKGFKDIQTKKKGLWMPDPQKQAEVMQEIRAWEKENGLKPKNLTPTKPTDKPKETEEKPKSALDAFSDKVGRAKEEAGSKVQAFVDSMRGKKE